MSLYPTPGPERTFRPVRLKQARRVGSGSLAGSLGVGVGVGGPAALGVGRGPPQAGIATAKTRVSSQSRYRWFFMNSPRLLYGITWNLECSRIGECSDWLGDGAIFRTEL